MNNNGDVTGDAYINAAGYCYDEQTFLYTGKNKTFVDLNGPVPGFGGCNFGMSINDSAQIAFNQDQPGHTGSGDYTAHRFTPPNTVINLGTLPGDAVSYAIRINETGDVVGGSAADDPPNYLLGDPFLYTHGRMIDLGTLGGGRGQANGINAFDIVVGWSRTRNTPVGDYWNPGHAFVWVPWHSGLIDLNSINKTPGWNLRTAAAINRNEFIVGYGLYNPVGMIQAFRYNLFTQTTRDLGTFPGGGFSYALDINSTGWVVGAAYLDASGVGNYRAAVWPRGNPGALNLNNMICGGTGPWILDQAVAINNSGQILASGADPNNNHAHAFLLTPVRACI